MKTNKHIGANFFEHFWDKSWIYTRTVVDVAQESVLLLDKNFCIVAANEVFYQTFQTKPKSVENKGFFELGNGQWDIPSLRMI